MRTLFAFAVLSLVTACQAPPPPEPEFTEADRQAIAQEIERLTLEMIQLNRPEDAPEMFTYWSESAESYFTGEPALYVMNLQMFPTMQAMREFADPSRWSGRQSTNFTLLSSRVAVLSPEHAVQVTEMHWSITGTSGNTGPTYPQIATNVWIKEDGEWKMIHHHDSYTNTPVEGETEG